MELEYYLSLAWGFEPFPSILGSGSSLVSLSRSFLLLSWSGSCEILHLFSSFFFSDLPVITLVARCFQWRARVALQVQQLSDEGSCESLRVVWICVNSCSVWCWWSDSMVNFTVSWYEIDLNWCWIRSRVCVTVLEIFWWICELWSVTAKRERKNLFVTWRVMNGFCSWHCTVTVLL